MEQIKKNNNKIYNKNKTNELGELYILYKDINGKNNSHDLNMNEKKEKDIIEYLIELYISFDILNNCINDQNKILKSTENYYLKKFAHVCLTESSCRWMVRPMMLWGLMSEI
jgi:hypothetical protein